MANVIAHHYHRGERFYRVLFAGKDGRELIAYGANPEEAEKRFVEMCNFEFGIGTYSYDISYHKLGENAQSA